ncbi:hypothetical protein M2222_003555 [Bradyrhizobium elkanii]|jgi:hypothetical protein|nr:hypothetical protein [Bradyrhizobium elkanii]MCS3561233.1 hypothetical protein [Bradyrhizobium elkanii]MCW2148924.1 hypothetical protein [Bradyrhizobium elkanii]MCW2351988.1 hypothetical protein [Bradyrhizobium elkanii]MCW2372653.1 hypothetical protein [Bradyrhizobium elkanii]
MMFYTSFMRVVIDASRIRRADDVALTRAQPEIFR